METTKEEWWEAEVNRTAGEIALKSPKPDAAKAETYFERALAVARQQQAKSWELRAAMSLARLWRSRANRSKLATCWLRCTAGSLKGSTRSIEGGEGVAGGVGVTHPNERNVCGADSSTLSAYQFRFLPEGADHHARQGPIFRMQQQSA